MKKVLALLLIAFTVLLCSCTFSGRQKYTYTYFGYLDTTCEVIAYADSKAEFDALKDRIDGILKYYDAMLDIYGTRGPGGLHEINDNAGIKETKVSDDLMEFIKACRKAADITNDETNPMMGAVTSLWKKADNTTGIPTDEQLSEASKHIDKSKCEYNETDNTVYISDPDASIDPGAVAKGYIAEIIADEFKDSKMSICLNLGGNVKVFGSSPDKGWRIGIQNPDTEKAPVKVLTLYSGYSCVTSGSYERYTVINGIKYHHIIDKDTLKPLDTYLSVTVVSKDSFLCDTLSTALFCMSVDEGKEILGNYEDVYVVYITADGDIIYTGDASKEVFR